MEIVQNLSKAIENPFSITVCEDSLKTVLIFLLAYGMGIGIYLSTRRNYRRREEHGSAKWGDAGAVNKKYRDKDLSANKLLTQNVRIGLDGKKHRRNLNILVCGGSGAGKTRFFCKPNAMQCNTSMVILDPKGEIVRDVGGLLEKKGYEVRVLDLINMQKSHCYNPFVYLRNDNDVQRLVTNLFKATTPKGSQSQDPFWDTAASMLLLSLVFYLKYEAPPEEQNFPMVMELLRAGEVREDDDSYVSPLDELFDRLEMVNPEHIALKYYRDYHSGSAKTLKSTGGFLNFTFIPQSLPSPYLPLQASRARVWARALSKAMPPSVWREQSSSLPALSFLCSQPRPLRLTPTLRQYQWCGAI